MHTHRKPHTMPHTTPRHTMPHTTPRHTHTTHFIVDKTKTCTYADDSCLYACDNDMNNLLTHLLHDSSLAMDWFEYSYKKLNNGKCHPPPPPPTVLDNKYEHLWV